VTADCGYRERNAGVLHLVGEAQRVPGALYVVVEVRCGTLASRQAEITGSEVRMYRSRAEVDESCAADHLVQGRTVVEVKAPHLGSPGRSARWPPCTSRRRRR